MKIDCRFIVDTGDVEVDVRAGEAARSLAPDSKICSDERKLVIEGKDVVDGLLELIS